MRTTLHKLIVITGPVGAGKSTTGVALAATLRRAGVEVALLDLDELYLIVRQQDGYGEPAAWARARHGAGALASALFSTAMAVVIVEGEFFSADELDALLTPIPADVIRYVFTLRVSYARVLAHVQGDPSRGASRDPAFLHWLHTSFVQALPFLEHASTVLDTDALTLEQIVARIVAALDEHR